MRGTVVACVSTVRPEIQRARADRHQFHGHVQAVRTAGDPYVGEVVLAVAELVRAGDWSRIRVCANDACASVFYDTTRGRTRRWHFYEICGNRKTGPRSRAPVGTW